MYLRTHETEETLRRISTVFESATLHKFAYSTTTRKHDSKIILPLTKKVSKKHRINSLRGDMGYDNKIIRKELKSLGIRPLIKHREFTGKQKAWNVRIKKKDYNQRWKVETVVSVIKRKYGDFLASRKCFVQFKETKLMTFVYNIDVELRKFLLGFLSSLVGGCQERLEGYEVCTYLY